MSMPSMFEALSALPKLLDNLAHIISKGEENAKERGIEEEVFLNARLAPDMWPLKKQVHMVAALCKNAPYRAAGIEAPNYKGSPDSFEACYAVLERAKADIAKISAKDVEGKESRVFSVKVNQGEMEYTAPQYLSNFTLPNVHFHMTTCYNILRQNGVPLGKPDYFGVK